MAYRLYSSPIVIIFASAILFALAFLFLKPRRSIKPA